MTSEASTETIPTAARHRAATGLLRLAVKGGLLLTAAYAVAFAITFFEPEENDYGRSSVLKHDRLAAIDTKKIVLVGGSNLAFGTDSTLLERETGCGVVNMGMNGYFGVRFMLSEIQPELNPGDIVVVAFEMDSFFKSVDGTSFNLLAVVKANPAVARFLTLKQQASVLAAVPLVAQTKIMRIMRETYDGVMGSDENEVASSEVDIADIETFSNFVETGDLVGHLGVEWPNPLEQGRDVDLEHFEPEAIEMMRDFTTLMESRGVRVMISYSPLEETFYRDHQAAVDGVHEAIVQAPPLPAPSPPTAYVYDTPLFFDTVYHVNAEGREARTRQIVQDLHTQFGNDAICAATAIAQQAGE